MMAHAQKPDFVFWQNGQVHLNRRGGSVQSTTGSQGVGISGSNAGYTMFWGSVKSTGYTLHSHSFPSTSPPVRHRVPSSFNWTLPQRAVDIVMFCSWVDIYQFFKDNGAFNFWEEYRDKWFVWNFGIDNAEHSFSNFKSPDTD